MTTFNQVPAWLWTVLLFGLAVPLGVVVGRAVSLASWRYARPPSAEWMADYTANYKGESGDGRQDDNHACAACSRAPGMAAVAFVGATIVALCKRGGVRRPGVGPKT